MAKAKTLTEAAGVALGRILEITEAAQSQPPHADRRPQGLQGGRSRCRWKSGECLQGEVNVTFELQLNPRRSEQSRRAGAKRRPVAFSLPGRQASAFRSADDRAARRPCEGHEHALATRAADDADGARVTSAIRARQMPIRSALSSARSGVQPRPLARGGPGGRRDGGSSRRPTAAVRTVLDRVDRSSVTPPLPKRRQNPLGEPAARQAR